MEKNMPNFLKIKRSDISGPLTFIIPDIITPAVWLIAIGGVAPHNHELAHFYCYSFKANKICHTIAVTIKTSDIFHYFGVKCFRTAAIQSIDRFIEQRREASTTNHDVI